MHESAPGDIVLAPVRNPDNDGVKHRPLLVVSRRRFTRRCGLIVVVGVFSEPPVDARRAALRLKSVKGRVRGFVGVDWLFTIHAAAAGPAVDRMDGSQFREVLTHVREGMLEDVA